MKKPIVPTGDKERRQYQKELEAHWKKVNAKEKEILDNIHQQIFSGVPTKDDLKDISYVDHPNKLLTGQYDIMYKDQFVGTMAKTINGVNFTGSRVAIDIPERPLQTKGEC